MDTHTQKVTKVVLSYIFENKVGVDDAGDLLLVLSVEVGVCWVLFTYFKDLCQEKYKIKI